jgi:hypothetical protein
MFKKLTIILLSTIALSSAYGMEKLDDIKNAHQCQLALNNYQTYMHNNRPIQARGQLDKIYNHAVSHNNVLNDKQKLDLFDHYIELANLFCTNGDIQGATQTSTAAINIVQKGWIQLTQERKIILYDKSLLFYGIYHIQLEQNKNDNQFILKHNFWENCATKYKTYTFIESCQYYLGYTLELTQGVFDFYNKHESKVNIFFSATSKIGSYLGNNDDDDDIKFPPNNNTNNNNGNAGVKLIMDMHKKKNEPKIDPMTKLMIDLELQQMKNNKSGKK